MIVCARLVFRKSFPTDIVLRFMLIRHYIIDSPVFLLLYYRFSERSLQKCISLIHVDSFTDTFTLIFIFSASIHEFTTPTRHRLPCAAAYTECPIQWRFYGVMWGNVPRI